MTLLDDLNELVRTTREIADQIEAVGAMTPEDLLPQVIAARDQAIRMSQQVDALSQQIEDRL